MNETTAERSIETITLKHGSHESPEAGMCAMEAVAWLAGEPHSDAPACACPVIAGAMIRLNDRIKDDATRTELLRPLLPKIIGTRASREVMIKRGYVAADMACRVFAPMALEARGYLDLAKHLRDLAPVVDRATAEVASREARATSHRAAAADADAAAAYAAAAYAAAAYADAADAAYAAAAAADDAYDAAADAAAGRAARAKAWERQAAKLLELLAAAPLA